VQSNGDDRYNALGKRVTRKASGRTKTEAKTKLRELLREYDDRLSAMSGGYTVGDAVNYWLTYGLSGRDPYTVSMYRTYAGTHIIPEPGSASCAS
jgi:hypothetical protein